MGEFLTERAPVERSEFVCQKDPSEYGLPANLALFYTGAAILSGITVTTFFKMSIPWEGKCSTEYPKSQVDQALRQKRSADLCLAI